MSDTPKSYESDTPETQEAVERWRQGKINIFDEMARLERERDEAINILREINDRINVAVMRPPTPNEAAHAINTWGDKIRPILEVTE